jgi:tetratricopeptide (TPR) repeat protein
VLEGSVRRAGSSLRITAQLIEAANDAHLWAEKYTGTIGDVFDMQEKVSHAIVEALKVTLTADETRRFAARTIPDIKAFDLYLEARQALYRLTEPALDRALQLVQEAIGIVGPNALLFSLAAEIEFFYHDQGIHTDEETLRRADSWAARALALDPRLAAGFRARGLIRGRKGDMLQEIRDLQKARELQPSGDHLGYLAWILAEVGRTAEARICAAEMVAVDPLQWLAHWALAWVAILDGDFETADARTKKAAELGGSEPVQLFFRGISSAYAGRLDEACGFFSRVVEMEGAGVSMVAAVLRALFRRDAEAARGLLQDDALRALARFDKEFSWWLAAGCSFAGETDEALDWLANAVDLGFVNHHFFSTIDPFLAPLRGDPRFQALMVRAREVQGELAACL